ncbi:ABC transporter ATP-binding protein [Aliikangiella coralliicola]|uniref:ABC transporter ATP-binding protein n=1 Tax=Aliikangiella coralliicola TaxID=2592383 RepID=A0A545UIK8_9GAMM|nr:ABC transporter ATP-binding protein [Aliikangiella coralliicola]TQV89299.1 ABC transporter ATP-binding protein [Aliikangiella coralliicola]
MTKHIILGSVGHHFQTENRVISLFQGLSLTVSSAETNAIVGPSGVGKSSLLLILAGLETPQSGNVVFSDGGVAQPLLALRQQSGFIFQQFHLLPELDAINNIALPLKLKGDKSAMEKAEEWLCKVGLENRAKHKPSQLSGGEQQRIAIARAFVTEPAFVFADEPTGNLDEKTAKDIVELMFECSDANQTGLVVVTHSKALSKMADHCYELSQQGLLGYKDSSVKVA